MKEKKLFTTANLIKMALLSVIAVLLMQFGAIKLPTFFPSFLELDFSEVPAIVGILTVHPFAGLIIVILKNILKVVLFGTNTAYAGELANMVVSLGYVLPLTLMTLKRNHLKQVGIGMALGVISMTLVGALINYYVTIPMYAKLFMPMDTIIQMGHVIFPKIVDKFTLIIYSFIPFNLFKGTVVAIIGGVLISGMKPVIVHLGYRAETNK